MSVVSATRPGSTVPTPTGSTAPAGPDAPGARPAPPALRLLPAPSADPPYDDEISVRSPAREPALRLAPAPLRLVPALPGQEQPWARPRTRLDELAPAHLFARSLVQRLLEVLAGVRPVAQLQRDTSPELYTRLEELVVARPRTTGARPDSRAVRSVHVQTQPQGVAEVCATIKRLTPAGPRASALALRLEGLEGRWCCTELLGI